MKIQKQGAAGKMKNEQHLYQSIYKTLLALLILLTIYTAIMPEIVSAQNPQPPGIEVTTQNNFGEKFRAGRDLIDRQEWARATEQFREAVEKNPDHKLVDAALYWLAFCYKKQKKIEEADVALNRLFKEFPTSSWVGDAQVMKTEILPFLRRIYDDSFNADKNPKFAQGQFSADLQAQVTGGTINKSGQNSSSADKPANTDRLPLARADEIKLAAFQSLLTADPRRAIETMGEVLKPDSNAGESLKREILRVWRKSRLFASKTLVSDINQNIGGEEFVSLLRETLIKSFQSEKNLKIRIEIIYLLAGLADEQSLTYLKQLYATENHRDIKKDIINSFGSSATVFYPFGSDIAQKKKGGSDITREQTRKIELDFLLELVRAEKDAELRRLAFSNLRHFKNWLAGAPAVEVLTRLYDAEADQDFKLALVRAFAESKQSAAMRKLLDIAKNDQSDKLRLEAIYSLRTSKDPEVIKFLEDLIK
jgi:thioredoxin-like negative regulator of GroEL